MEGDIASYSLVKLGEKGVSEELVLLELRRLGEHEAVFAHH
jgi:hypothetical protein